MPSYEAPLRSFSLSAWITSTNVLEENGMRLETPSRAAREDLKRVPDLKRDRRESKNHENRRLETRAPLFAVLDPIARLG
jgi:hypothetical protein